MSLAVVIRAPSGRPRAESTRENLINKEEADSNTSPDDIAPGEPFAALGLSPLLVEGLIQVGYNQPTEIQRLGIPPALAGSDLIGTAHTGTGKTAVPEVRWQ